MFFEKKDGTLINIEAITAITVVRMRDFSGYNLYSLEEMAKFGFKVGHPDKFIHCKNWDEAVEAVEASPESRILSKGAIGYFQLEGCEEIGLINSYYEKSAPYGCFVKRESAVCFLLEERLNDPFAYNVHLSTPCGGINNDHMVFTFTLEEYESLRECLTVSKSR